MYFNIYKNKKKILKKIKKNTWTYHYFIPVYQQSLWYDLQFLRYREWQTEIGNYGSFFALLPSPPKNKKNQNFQKWKKLLEISSFYTSVPKTTIIWVTVPEIQSKTDRIFCHFTPITTGKIKTLKKWKKHLEMLSLYTCEPNITIIWSILPEIWNTTDRTFCHFGLFFVLLPPWQPRKSKFWKNEKMTVDIIILHMCTINENHMMYGSWDMECDRQSFFLILDNFLPLLPC